MATLLGLQKAYKYSLQDKGGTLEEINGVPPSPANDVRDKAIAEAINYYSTRFPRVRTVDVVVVDDGFYDLPLDWQDYSDVVSIESPVDMQPPQYLGKKSFGFVSREDVTKLWINPNPEADFRLTYTTVHGGGVDEVSSIPASHENTLGKLSASIAAVEFAARYANTVSNNVDAVNYRSKEQEWRAVAKELREQFEREILSPEWNRMFATDIENRPGRGWRF